MARVRRASVEAFVEGAPQKLERSDEQLAPVMARWWEDRRGDSWSTCPTRGRSKIFPAMPWSSASPRSTAWACTRWPVGRCPIRVQDVLAGHVARQELIVEAALTGCREPALSALATDPLVRDPMIAGRMLDELLVANALTIDSDGTY
jgi:hypothetical protein